MSTIDQRYALACLVGYCEAIVTNCKLDQQVEWQLRIRIAEVLTAFNMASKYEMEATNVEMAQ